MRPDPVPILVLFAIMVFIALMYLAVDAVVDAVMDLVAERMREVGW